MQPFDNARGAPSTDASMTEDAASFATEAGDPAPVNSDETIWERPASAKLAGARRVPFMSSPRQPASAAKPAPARPSMRAARDEFGTTLAGEEDAPMFEPAHWAALRPASAPVRHSLHAASHSSVIRTGNSTPRRPKCDPVSMSARHKQQWASSSFLANSPHRSVKVYSPAPAPATQSRNRRRPPVSNYEVPTAKRRDALITETRQRMRYCDAQRSSSRGLVRRADARPCTPRHSGAPCRPSLTDGCELHSPNAGTESVRAADRQASRRPALASALGDGVAVVRLRAAPRPQERRARWTLALLPSPLVSADSSSTLCHPDATHGFVISTPLCDVFALFCVLRPRVHVCTCARRLRSHRGYGMSP